MTMITNPDYSIDNKTDLRAMRVELQDSIERSNVRIKSSRALLVKINKLLANHKANHNV